MRQNKALWPALAAAPSKKSLVAFSLALLACSLLAACLSDGPNRTGGEYLVEHGIVLETPLHKAVLSGFPADTFWTADLEPSRLGDSVILVGARGGFSSQARLIFDLNDTAHLDSLDAPGSLRLSLGFLQPPISSRQLAATLSGVDSMRFLVETFVYRDTGLSKERRADTLAALNRSFLVNQVPAALFDPGAIRRDTIALSLDSAISEDSPQAVALPSLRDTLLAGQSDKWIVLMQVSPLAPADSGAMLRLVGTRYSGSNPAAFAPWLLFGNPAIGSASATAKQRRSPVTLANGRLGVNSMLRFEGSPTSILLGKTRGLHFRIDRDTLLARLEAALDAQGVAFRRTTDGRFDLSYFVPFARIAIPIESSTVEGDFLYEFRLDTDLDSLLPGLDEAASRAVLALGEDTILFSLTDRFDRDKIVDSLIASYDEVPQDAGLRRFILRSGKDSNVADTSYLRLGEARTVRWSSGGSRNDRLAVSVRADSASALLAYHIDTKSLEDDNSFRDPETGETLVEISDRIPRLFDPDTDTLALRSTRGVQRVLNRVRLGEDIFGDFLVQPRSPAAIDTGEARQVPYSVLGEIQPLIQDGRLEVSLTVYLYPLKDR
jgi:hypothetical protein